MKKAIPVLLLAVALTLTTGCPGFSTVLGDISASITKFSPLLSIGEAAVCVAGGPACGLVSSFVVASEPFAAQLSNVFGSWSSASASAAPGFFPQLEAAVAAWQNQLKSGLNIPGLSSAQQAQYTPVIEAEMNAANDLAVTLQAALEGGGTPQALADILNHADALDDNGSPAMVAQGYSPADYFAMWSPAKIGRLVRAPRTFKLKNGAVVHTWAYHKSRLIERMSKKTGDKAIDAWQAKCIERIKQLG